MTEQQLDALRPLAATIHDEGSRLVRSLKGSSANEPTVREHLRNCLKACQDATIAIERASLVDAGQSPDQLIVTGVEFKGMPESTAVNVPASAMTKTAAEEMAKPPVFPALRNRKK